MTKTFRFYDEGDLEYNDGKYARASSSGCSKVGLIVTIVIIIAVIVIIVLAVVINMKKKKAKKTGNE